MRAKGERRFLLVPFGKIVKLLFIAGRVSFILPPPLTVWKYFEYSMNSRNKAFFSSSKMHPDPVKLKIGNLTGVKDLTNSKSEAAIINIFKTY